MGAIQNEETIAALATPSGTSAIALIRVSGPASAVLARTLFERSLAARHAHYGNYRTVAGVILDAVVATYFAGPASYTGEHVLEISCHGNPFIARKLLDDLVARGCRLAQPGEFTQRAFLNGRMDLSQAEAVMDVIQARSERALGVAQQQLAGSLGRHLAGLNRELLDTLARIEAYIDFPDEDLPPEDRSIVRESVQRVMAGTKQLLATRRYGEILRSGIRTVILGAPNAGKSSLLNRLVGYERALVSPEPGTTRDFIEETILVGGHALRLIDTAGLNPAPGEIERLGIEKTYEQVREADLVLWVLDLTTSSPALPAELIASLRSETTVVVGNKADLVPATDAATVLAAAIALLGGESISSDKTCPVSLCLSATTGAGLERLTAAIEMIADSFQVETGAEVIAVNTRHAHALERALVGVAAAETQLKRALETDIAPAPELVASDLREALQALGEISGKFDNERMLDRLFATFCIGK